MIQSSNIVSKNLSLFWTLLSDGIYKSSGTIGNEFKPLNNNLFFKK